MCHLRALFVSTLARLLDHEDDTGIATQNHAEAFNKSMPDVRQLNPVLQVKS